jgi:hypothetical protein
VWSKVVAALPLPGNGGGELDDPLPITIYHVDDYKTVLQVDS